MQHNYYFVLLSITTLSCIKGEIINTKVVQQISIESQLVKLKSVVTIQNIGIEHVKKLVYTLDPNISDFHITFKHKNKELKFEKVNMFANVTQHAFEVFFDRNLMPQESYIVKVLVVYIDQIVPLYKRITFKQNQLISYKGNLLYYSPYKTLLLKKSYGWKSDVEDLQLSHTPHFQLGSNSSYLFKNLKPFSFEQMEMEFINNDPLMVVESLERIIDISHFGQICVEDRINIKNEGSKLVGPYERELVSDQAAKIGWWYTHLPAAVENVEFFDTLGVNYKSNLLNFNNFKTLKFKPRYPLLGGWKTFYIIKYCVPTYEYLFHDRKKYFVLKMRAVDHILNDVVVRKAYIKVLLPEASEIISADVPLQFDRLSNEKHFTGLCMFGRPTVVLNASNIVENHIADFTIRYLFPPLYLLRAPLVLVLYLEVLFLFVIIIVRIK